MLKRVMIISGESSGELYGALLAKALKRKNPMLDIIGVGGQRMQAAGVKLISQISSAFGVLEALKSYKDVKETYKKVISTLRSINPQVIVLIDYPDFNLRVAKEAKKLGIKILYYVSPQVWAWRKSRIKVIGRLIDKIALVLPFEEEIYKNANIPCEFVGHPVFDEIKEVLNDLGFKNIDLSSLQSMVKSKIKDELGLAPDKPTMALMPGSRFHEIKRLFPLMNAVAIEMKKSYPDYQFVIPIAPNLCSSALSIINDELKKNSHNIILNITHHSIKTLLASDIAIIASGTSTLQAAILGVPMVVVYKLSPLTFFLGRLIVKVRHISLVNILLDYISSNSTLSKRSIDIDNISNLRIKELLQKKANKENIMLELSRIINDHRYKDEMVSQFKTLLPLFADKEASMRVAEMVVELSS